MFNTHSQYLYQFIPPINTSKRSSILPPFLSASLSVCLSVSCADQALFTAQITLLWSILRGSLCDKAIYLHSAFLKSLANLSFGQLPLYKGNTDCTQQTWQTHSHYYFNKTGNLHTEKWKNTGGLLKLCHARVDGSGAKTLSSTHVTLFRSTSNVARQLVACC